LEPDIVCLSKPLAGGLPLSATLIPERVDNELHLGAHGTTFGGGPVTTAVAGTVLDIVLNEDFLEEVRRKAGVLDDALSAIAAKVSGVKGVKGLGFLKGLDIASGEKIPDVMSELQRQGLLVLRSGTSVLRIAPPLIIDDEDLLAGLSLVEQTCAEIL
jgi:acetylornithine/N-succinyldiaminopimelate aminotransferase